MKLSRRDLNILIENYLHEGEFGRASDETTIDKPMFEKCDLSDLPSIFVDFFEAVRNKDVKKTQRALDKQIALSNNPEEIERLQQKREELQDPGFWEKLSSHGATLNLLNFFTGTLSVFGLLNKTDCDAIIRKAEIYVENFLIPMFGLDSERIRSQRALRRGANRNTKSVAGKKNNKNVMTFDDLIQRISFNFREIGVVNVKARNQIQEIVLESALPSFCFDLFELFSPDEYLNFVNNPKEEIPNSALLNFKNSLKILKANGSNNFNAWSTAFTLATPGISADVKVQRMMSSIDWQAYFDSPDDLNQYIGKCLNRLIRNKKLNFADVGFLTNVN